MPTFFTPVKVYVQKNTTFISRVLGATLKNNETRAICGVDIRDTKYSCGDISIRQNETATLANSGFGSFPYEGSISNGSGIVTRGHIVSNQYLASSILVSTVENSTKPPEGIEPSEIGVTISVPHLAGGVFQFYHNVMSVRVENKDRIQSSTICKQLKLLCGDMSVQTV